MPLRTHLGRALMRPRWRRLAETNSPDGHGKPAGWREAPEGTAGLTFFGTFFVQRQRKYIKAGTAHAHAVQCESGYEVVKNLAKPSVTSSLDARTADAPRCAVLMPLLAARQEVAKNRAKGPNALWIPAVRHEKSQIFLIVAQK